ncbi:MAG: Calx-beta domain-containing protein [Burkholderiaceae bacterium]
MPEGNSGTTTYFLLQFTGVRSNPSQLLSVDYTTRDGSAIAGQDYLATHGTLVLYPNEIQAVIPVEIIGDATPEQNETFYLDVSNPVGVSFGDTESSSPRCVPSSLMMAALLVAVAVEFGAKN